MSNLDKFCVFILCHGRPDNTPTWNTMRKYNYTGPMYIVCDDEDSTVDKYRENFGAENVLIFSKDEMAKIVDTRDTTKSRKCAVYARNACFRLAKQLGYQYFCEMDDDYVGVPYRWVEDDGKMYRSKSSDLDKVFDAYIDYLNTSPDFYSVAFAQPGDLIGGANSFMHHTVYVRKCMNSWICDVDKYFEFHGTMNDDVNTYLDYGRRGKIFFTCDFIMIDQPATQSVDGGMTELYKGEGTYIKTFYALLSNPSNVKIDMMGDRHYRIHHHVDWPLSVPRILSSSYKKNYNKGE